MKTVNTLFDVSEKLKALEEQVPLDATGNNENENEEEDFDRLLSAIRSLELQEEERVNGISAWIRSLEGEAELIGREIARLTARKRGRENKAAALRRYLLEWLQSTGRHKFKTEYTTVSVLPGREQITVDTDRLLEWPPDVYDHAIEIGAIRTNVQVLTSKLVQALPSTWKKLPGVTVSTGNSSITIK